MMGVIHFAPRHVGEIRNRLVPLVFLIVGILTGGQERSPCSRAYSVTPQKGNLKAHRNRQQDRLNARLVSAARRHDYGTVQRMIESDADVNVRIPRSRGTSLTDELVELDGTIQAPLPLLTYSIVDHRPGVLDLLLHRHASVDARGDVLLTIGKGSAQYGVPCHNVTALQVAAILGEARAVSRLIKAKARVDARSEGETALDMSVAFYHAEVLDLLIRARANVNVKDSLGRTPLVSAARNGNRSATRQLLRAGARPSIRDSMGKSPLAWAVELDELAIVPELINAGSDVNGIDMDGYTILKRAAETGDQKLYDTLKAHGAKGTYRVEFLHPRLR
jgi:hypothetical protein